MITLAIVTIVGISFLAILFYAILYESNGYYAKSRRMRPHRKNMDERLHNRKIEREENIKSSLNGTITKKKYYLKQDSKFTMKYCLYCGTELVNVSFTTFCYRHEDTGLYYCMSCNLETDKYMKGEQTE